MSQQSRKSAQERDGLNSRFAIMTLEYANEYPDVLPRKNGGASLSDRTFFQGSALKKNGKSEVVFDGVSPDDPALDLLGECVGV
ncbi:hypothetical protein [Paracoccus sp. SY]|uniref:hypothetical protein n=1 Tax=Paracoccus sp. SY TaxID=1330255 RepID=UPI0011AF6CE7|nr:hypothetical protein [Paracoccus sp. SY]